MLRHVNGFETAYGHMSRIADITQVGATVRQGQIIGYVGHTGDATGPHLHFEVRINGNFVDPLSVKLPRDKTLPAQDDQQFAETVVQIQDLMKRDAVPVVAGPGRRHPGQRPERLDHQRLVARHIDGALIAARLAGDNPARRDHILHGLVDVLGADHRDNCSALVGLVGVHAEQQPGAANLRIAPAIVDKGPAERLAEKAPALS